MKKLIGLSLCSLGLAMGSIYALGTDSSTDTTTMTTATGSPIVIQHIRVPASGSTTTHTIPVIVPKTYTTGTSLTCTVDKNLTAGQLTLMVGDTKYNFDQNTQSVNLTVNPGDKITWMGSSDLAFDNTGDATVTCSQSDSTTSGSSDTTNTTGS